MDLDNSLASSLGCVDELGGVLSWATRDGVSPPVVDLVEIFEGVGRLVDIEPEATWLVKSLTSEGGEGGVTSRMFASGMARAFRLKAASCFALLSAIHMSHFHSSKWVRP